MGNDGERVGEKDRGLFGDQTFADVVIGFNGTTNVLAKHLVLARKLICNGRDGRSRSTTVCTIRRTGEEERSGETSYWSACDATLWATVDLPVPGMPMSQ